MSTYIRTSSAGEIQLRLSVDGAEPLRRTGQHPGLDPAVQVAPRAD